MKSSKTNIVCLFILLCFTNVCVAQAIKILNKRINATYDLHSNKILELCNSYVENRNQFRYGYKLGAFRKEVIPIDERYEINCSTFSMLISLGISFENSQYKDGGNYHIFRNRYTEDILKWFSDSIQVKYSRDIAQKMYTDGYCLIPNENFSNLESGDILFFNLDSSNDRPGIDFMGVDHSAIFGYRFGNKYIIYEVGDDNGPQKILKSKESMGKVVLVGRMPRDHAQYSKPIMLEYNEIEKNLNFTGDGKMNYNLAEIHFKSPLKKGRCYTLFVNAHLEKGIWLNATYNSTSLYAFNLTNVRDYRPSDSIYQIHFTAPDDIITLSLNVRSNLVEEIITDYHFCILYDGFVTNNNK